MTSKIHTWLKKHKGILITGGLGFVALTVYVLLRQPEQPECPLLQIIPDENEQDSRYCDITPIPGQDHILNAIERSPHSVSEHIRNLPFGYHASADKIATAYDHGYVLEPGQTWVESYRTGS